MTCRINLTIVVNVVDLDTSRIYSSNHMVGMDKIFSSDMKARGKQKKICRSSTLRKVNGTTTSLVNISRSKIIFLLKHLPLFYNRSRKTPICI
jgi:hypothetical protein